jgi:endonuclease/exonuclease/phosphatase family metal-dependent hydrolase
MDIFSLLSLNTFGVPFYLSVGRIKRLAAEINRLNPTVACLQEVQQNAYLPLLQRGLAAYPQLTFYRNALAPKGGLFTASDPISPGMKGEFHPFGNQGKPVSIGFSDWALNKGVLLVELEFHEHRFVILNTHLQANYRGNWRLSNEQTQIQLDQVKDLVKLIQSQPVDAWVIVCGDFNFPRQSPAYQEMISQSGLSDALADDPRHTYRPFPLVSRKWQTSLDYIFYRIPAGEDPTVTADILPIENTFAVLPYQRFLTDHNALTLNIRWDALQHLL